MVLLCIVQLFKQMYNELTQQTITQTHDFSFGKAYSLFPAKLKMEFRKAMFGTNGWSSGTFRNKQKEITKLSARERDSIDSFFEAAKISIEWVKGELTIKNFEHVRTFIEQRTGNC